MIAGGSVEANGKASSLDTRMLFGFLAINLPAGETVLVSNATGNFGTSGIIVALAMEAGCIIAMGRNQARLDELARRFGPRVRTVKFTGNEEEDRKQMKEAAPGPIDCVLDMLPPEADTKAVRAAAMTVVNLPGSR